MHVLFTIAASHAISIFFLLKFTSQMHKVKIHKPQMHKVRAASKCNNLVSPSVSPVRVTNFLKRPSHSSEVQLCNMYIQKKKTKRMKVLNLIRNADIGVDEGNILRTKSCTWNRFKTLPRPLLAILHCGREQALRRM